jgi:hypothetical protein
MLSADVLLAIAPAREYQRLVQEPGTIGPVAALRRPAFVALLIGVLLAICATGRVTLGLVASTTACWSIAPAVQAAAGAAIIASSRRRQVGMARAVDLFFAGHVPWSLWMLAVAGWSMLREPAPITVLLSSVAIPVAWTAVIVFAFCRTVLQAGARGALVRTAVHQALIWGVAVAIAVPNVGGWARVVATIRR